MSYDETGIIPLGVPSWATGNDDPYDPSIPGETQLLLQLNSNLDVWRDNLDGRLGARTFEDPQTIPLEYAHTVLDIADDSAVDSAIREVALGIVLVESERPFGLATQASFGSSWREVKQLALEEAHGVMRRVVAHHPELGHRFATLAAERFQGAHDPSHEDDFVIKAVTAAAPHLRTEDLELVVDQLRVGEHIDTYNGFMGAGFGLLTEPSIPLELKKRVISTAQDVLDQRNRYGTDRIRDDLETAAYYLITGKTLSGEVFFQPRRDDQELGRYIQTLLAANPEE